MNRFVWFTAMCLGLAARLPSTTAAARQAPVEQKPPVFRAGTIVVPLAVTVLDKSGRQVTDLKQTDFSVFENGKPREIVSFFPEALVAREAGPTTAPAESRPLWQRSVTPRSSRTFLFVLGFGRIQIPTKAIDGVMQFIKTQALPQDAIAVLAFNRATDFTSDHERILRMLDRYKRDHERIVFNIKEFRIFNRLGKAQPASTQADIDAIFQGPPPGDPMRNAADLLLDLSRPTQIREAPGQPRLGVNDVRIASEAAGVPVSDLVTESSLLKIYAGIEHLRRLDGEKRLVFLGGEIEISSADQAAALARRASDAHVTLDIVRTLGTPSMFAVPKEFADLPNGGVAGMVEVQQLETAAALTGGLFTGVSMAEKALTTIDQRSRFSYLIGYEPVNTTLDGAFRDVRVTVNRPGLTVLFQHGYFATDQPDPDAVNDAVARARVEAVVRVNATSTDIGLTVHATAAHSGPSQEIVVDLTIDASRLAFQPTNDGRYAVNVMVGAYGLNSRGQLIGTVTGRLSATLDEQTYQTYRASGIPYQFRLPVSDLPSSLKVIASDYGSGLIGTAVVKVGSK